jgi:hypothetical protein
MSTWADMRCFRVNLPASPRLQPYRLLSGALERTVVALSVRSKRRTNSDRFHRFARVVLDVAKCVILEDNNFLLPTNAGVSV